MTETTLTDVVMLCAWAGFGLLAWRKWPTMTAPSPRRLLRVMAALLALAAAMQTGALWLGTPASRTYVMTAAIAVALVAAVRSAGKRGQAVAAETANLDGYTVRSAGQRVAAAQAAPQPAQRQGYASASPTVRAIENMEVE